LWKYRRPVFRDMKEARKRPLSISKNRLSKYQGKIAYRGFFLRQAISLTYLKGK
jgi:hypothetical protein